MFLSILISLPEIPHNNKVLETMARLRFSTEPVMFVFAIWPYTDVKIGGSAYPGFDQILPFSRLKLGGRIMCG